MIKISVGVLLIVSTFQAFSAERMHISFQSSQIKQGSIVEARIIFDAEVVQRLDLTKLRNITLAEYFYVYEAELPLRKMGEDSIGSDAKIIVLKIPSSQPVTHLLNNEKIEITWNNIEFIPTEASKGFVFSNFEIPGKKDFILIMGILLLLILLFFIGQQIFHRMKMKNEKKKRNEDLKKNLGSPTTYEEVVAIWKNKTAYINEFPHLDAHFRNLETVLFRYQFKLSQTEDEKKQVMEAYRNFVLQSKGGFNGI